MPIKILMPALSPTMTEGNLAKWLKNEGDSIKAGDVIAEIETDKATMEMESVDEGILAKIVVASGTENVPVNSLVAVMLEEGETMEDLAKMDLESSLRVIEPVIPAQAGISISSGVASATPGNEAPLPISRNEGSKGARIFASPLAKRIAGERNINLSNIIGSGPHGRIVKSDILNYKGGASSNFVRNIKEFNLISHSNIRKIIAKRLLESKQTVPHFYLSIECVLDKLLDLRAEMNNMGLDSYKLSVNDFIIKASALAMKDVPEVNASWSDEGMISYNNIDICVAVASKSGLVTPVIKNADFKNMVTLSGEMKELASKARENKLKPEEFQGGGFTISNLGMFGVKNFSAIINPPQSCILAVGEGSKRVVVSNDQMKIATVMDVTLSCDHRVVDGAVGAQFLKAFKGYIENPVKIILKEVL